MIKKEAFDVLRKIRMMLPNGAPNLDDAEIAALWTKALEDIPIEVLVKVAKDAIYTYDFFPSIAKLRQAAKDFGHSPVQVTHTLLEGTVEAPPKKIVPKVDYLEHWQTLFTDSHWQTCNYLHIDLPEPQKGEKQYTAEEVSKQCKRINAAGFRVTSVQYNSGKAMTENGRTEPNVTHSAIIQVIKPGVTKHAEDY